MLMIYSIMLLIFSLIMFMFSMMFLKLNFFFLFDWLIFNLNSVNYEFILLIDWMSMLFLSVVMMITSMVMLYSLEYMEMDLNIHGFFMLIFLFMLSMMFMILSPNMISILLGWDGLGLISYCLVIYYSSYSSYVSGMVTVLSNRIGDVMLLMSIGISLMYGSWNLFLYDNLMLMIIILLLITSMTKSAQIPFSVWLPMAMAAPTPVSALVHSSTLVTAGVYLNIRYNFVMFNSNFMSWLLMLSSFTMLMAGFMANFENDLKKIIAFSTLSQLGLMMSILSIGLWKLSFFHLLTHAMFKSLLFLCAGVMIHSMMNNQDIRFMGSLSFNMPYIIMMFNISSLSLCGFPFLSGFYSKDLIMEFMYMNNFNMLSFLNLLIGTIFTVSYSVRLYIYVFISEWKNLSLNYVSEGSKMMISMFMLYIYTIINGSLLSWIFFYNLDLIVISKNMKFLIYYLIFLGVILGFKDMMNLKFKSTYVYMYLKMFYLNNMYNEIYLKFLFLGLKNYLFVDKGWLEMYGFKFLYMNLNQFYLNIIMNYYIKFMYMLMIFMFYIFFMLLYMN